MGSRTNCADHDVSQSAARTDDSTSEHSLHRLRAASDRAGRWGLLASGTYDLGLETLQAESLVVSDRRTIFVHPVTSALTELLTVAQRDRTKPLILDQAFELLSDPRALLLVNGQSGRAAVQITARSMMTDDGDVEPRVRLMRPMERPTLPAATMAQTHWRETDRDTFARAWEREVADLPEFVETTIHVVAGLLLPIWKRLPRKSSQVYRIQTDAGETHCRPKSLAGLGHPRRRWRRLQRCRPRTPSPR